MYLFFISPWCHRVLFPVDPTPGVWVGLDPQSLLVSVKDWPTAYALPSGRTYVAGRRQHGTRVSVPLRVCQGAASRLKEQ